MATRYKLNDDAIVIDNGHSLDLYVHNTKKHLYPQTQKILRLLIEAGIHDWKVTREKMYECLWGEYQGAEKNCNDTIRGCIRQLRNALGKEAICSEYGVGYYLNEKPTISNESFIEELDKKPKRETQKISINKVNIMTPANENLDETENLKLIPPQNTVSLQELLEKIKYVKYELEEVRHNYEITRLAIQREISTCSEKSALVDSYLIALLALSDKLEHQLREIQTLQDEYRECKGMTEILMNSGDDGSPMRYAAICNSITIGNRRGDYIRIDEKAMILKYKIDEIKSYIKEVNKEFDFLKSTKQRLILTLDDLPF